MQTFRILFPLFGTIFAVFGLVRLILAWILYLKIHASRRWPETVGTVTGASLESLPGRGGSEHFRAMIKYSYNVGESEYGGKFKVDTFLGSSTHAVKNLQKFPPGYLLPVHYNPHKPQEVITQHDETNPAKLFGDIIIFIVGVSIIFIK